MEEKKTKHTPEELGTKPVGTLLWQYALPAIVAMLASSLYNMVDRFFIGQGMGDEAITGLGVTAPFMNLSVALGSMVGVGSSTVISLRLGQGKYSEAQRILGNAMMLNVLVGLVFMVPSLIFLRPILIAFGASEQTLPFAYDYMFVILLGNVFTHCYFGLNNVLRSAGHPTISMRLTLLTIALNCVLDPLFIFGFQWGIMGAALATVLSQMVSLAIQIRLLSDPRDVIHWRRGIYRLRVHIVRQVLAIGMSPFLMHLCSCAVVFFFNYRLREYGDMLSVESGGDLAIGSFSLINGVVFCFVMVCLGLCQGMQPIAGYNWGAQKDDRVWRVLGYTMAAGTAVTTAGFLVGELIPEQVIRIFGTSDEMTAIASHGFRLMVVMFPVVGTQMVIGNFFQSVGHAGKSIYMSLTRQVLFLIPCLWILPQRFGLDGIWMSGPVADGLAFINAAGILLWLVLREKKRKQTKTPTL
ncbi:MAG: MATE family efflux transporter [Bacteroidaceae bacterium]|nr:MATE family efflux transporter [Bacteroidaceae bacterium]